MAHQRRRQWLRVKRILAGIGSAGAMMMLLQATGLAEDKVAILMKQHLTEVAGKEVTVLTVDYAPGAVSDPHVHPGSVIAYVLEGAVISQLEGGLPARYAKGQGWYEPPKKPHVVSKNASTTEPARLLVFLLSQIDEPIKAPLR